MFVICRTDASRAAEANEPILQKNLDRKCIFPLKHPDVWKMVRPPSLPPSIHPSLSLARSLTPNLPAAATVQAG